MKRFKNKIFTALVLAAAMLCMTACGKTTAEDAIVYDEAYLDSIADFLIANWSGLSQEDITAFAEMDADEAEAVIGQNGLPFEADAFTTGFAAYEAVAEDLGGYVSTLSYGTPEVSKDEVSLDVTVQYENREAVISLTFDEDSVVQSVDVSPRYSMSEILYKALMNTILGMGTVFIVLIFISLVIYCFNFIPAIQAKFGRKKKEEPPKAEPAALSEEPAAENIEEELADDTELVAAITAAICAYEGTSADGFVVRSIRRAARPSWNRV